MVQNKYQARTKMKTDILTRINQDTWIMADHHFNHKQILDFEPSRGSLSKRLGFESHEEMIIENHNLLVAPTDIVLFLGDFSFASPSIASKLNGRKILVIGNHDDRGDHAHYQAGFELVVRGTYLNFNDNIFHCAHPDPKQSMIIMPIKNHKVAFTHYPLGFDDSYNRQSENGSFSIQSRMDYSMKLADDFGVLKIIHGHLHSKLAQSTKFDYINVSGEHTNFAPVHIGDLL
jgi:calcineurin-like phosphoesterase family protein